MKKQALTIICASLTACGVFADAYKDAYAAGGKEEKAKKYEVAATSYLSAADVATKPQQKAEALFRAGECFRSISKFGKADDCYKKIIGLKDISSYTLGLAQLRIGQLLYWQNKYAESIAELEKVDDIKGVHLHLQTDAMLHCGYNYDRMKKYDKAEECYRNVMAQGKTYPHHLSRAAVCLGNDLRIQKKYEDALAEFSKVPEIPGAHPHHISDAYMNMGYVLREQKKYKEAIAAFEKCIAFEKAHPYHKSGSQVNIGSVLRDQKKYDEAIKAYAKTYDMKDASPYHIVEADRLTGYCYWDLHQYDKAKEYFEKVMAAKNTYSWQKDSAKRMLKAIAQKQKK